jgi:2-dehydropantoate 2-reductase
MKISIVGSGGVGGYFGGKLAKAGNDVTFLARGEHLKAMQSKGLTIKSVFGDFNVNPVKTTQNIKDLGDADLIIIGVKAWQLKDIAKELADSINENTVILPLQNGVLAIDELKEYINEKNIVGGLCRIFSKIDAPGIINHFGVDPTIVFGEIDNAKTARISLIKDVFDKAGFKAKIADDIQAEIWKKFISICVSGLLAVTRSTYGEIRELKETRQLMIQLLQEIFTLSQKMGIHIELDFLEKTITFIDTFPYESTSSLSRDVWEGKPSEIEYQNGTVVKLGEKFGVDTPVNRYIYNCILPMEIRARKK